MQVSDSLTAIELPISISPEKIFEINARAVLDENFRNELKKDPKLLAQLTGIPENVLRNVSMVIPPQPSAELKELISSVAKMISEQGIVAAEKFEYSLASAQNYIPLVATVIVIPTIFIIFTFTFTLPLMFTIAGV